ncbi:L,D-transpeptidase [Ensifer adhaerens]|uniref:L,D-transpeptidase n=1 Tax=Ensifer adhaerens TaxID=106592 RepID=UPI001CC00468|nr:L,D-transpeptidase [Ensifer adhaerens]MBZ7927016.1 L,D-transpeptidase [Ensifer adhaerens]UAX96680.1 L,D-transpeptidase [Ensifer adhaerens]UAY03976.1 L,D-transpeptidase [Ensifer adhaerens]UAY11962.1 L,D-transpeptidase [Ensifer adhaerens]
MTEPNEPSSPTSDHKTGITLTRRSLFVGAASLFVTGCATTRPAPTVTPAAVAPVRAAAGSPVPPMYYAMPDEQFPIPEVKIAEVDPKFWRQEVDYPSSERPGTLIVDTPAKYLYHVLPGGRAMRYGIGVGREGFAWSGRAIVAYKRKWPRWTPPDEMVARQPKLAPYSIANGGMPPGLKNPLGARALYIHKDGKDTLYRIHGSPEAHSIGKAVSSGCIRLLNQDVVYLHDQVRDGSTIVVIPDPTKGDMAIG